MCLALGKTPSEYGKLGWLEQAYLLESWNLHVEELNKGSKKKTAGTVNDVNGIRSLRERAVDGSTG